MAGLHYQCEDPAHIDNVLAYNGKRRPVFTPPKLQHEPKTK